MSASPACVLSASAPAVTSEYVVVAGGFFFPGVSFVALGICHVRALCAIRFFIGWHQLAPVSGVYFLSSQSG